MPKSNNKSNKTVQKTNKRKTSVTAVSKSVTKKTKAPVKEIKLMFPDEKLPRAPLLRLVKAMAKKEDPDARIQAQLLNRLEDVIQRYMSDLVTNTVRAARKEKRKTLMVKDLDFILDIRGNSGKVNISNVTAPATVASST